MKSSAIIAIVIAIIVILGGWYAYATYYMPATPSTATPINSDTTNGAAGTQETGTTGVNDTPGADVNVGADVNAGVTTGKTVKVTLTADGFAPKSVTINKGDTVTFTNTGSGQMWVGSDEHPSHTEYDGTSRASHCAPGYTGAKPFDECTAGNTYSFTFNKVGSSDFHNHLNPSQTGKVVVVE